MKTAVLHNYHQPLQFHDLPVPSIGPLDVLIKVHACGVCGSDVHLVDEEFAPLSQLPVVPGHEVAGVIEEVGEQVTYLKSGDRVGLPLNQQTCGNCRYCVRGETVLCPEQRFTGINLNGGYAEYVKAPARDVTIIPDAISFEEVAPLFCAGITVFTPFKYVNFQVGQRVAVLGIGGLGHLALQFAHVLGAHTIAVSRDTEKLHLAKEKLGADEAIDSSTKDWVKQLQDMGGADVILATAHSSQLMSQSIAALAPEGTLVVLGVDKEPLIMPPLVDLINNRKRVMGSITGSIKDMREMLNVAATHTIRPLIETYPLEDAQLALDHVRAGKPRFRAVLTMT
ncbi:MAG: alcohol dehydrogenase catalytic domain-containing protein [Aphanocapsa sp. GSE-SYN-MK-11-07L]|jgi:propanol-preferring alcohol dehydrogenase|nr:alcohol dehydrogenase catalytic domain-containing protein [Aphanocapsa sp. GSE-SYN-MK-11-07L]